MKLIGKIILILLFLLFIWLTNIYGQTMSGVDPFDEISVTGNLEVILTQGDNEEVTLEVEGIPEDKVTIKVERGILKLRLLNSIFYKDDEAKVHVTFKQLNVIRGQAGARIYCNDVLNAESLEFVANSGAMLEFEVETEKLEASASEGAILKLKGTTERHRASASTGGQYEAEQLTADIVYAKASTGGTVEVNAEESLEASVNTGGVIKYTGNPGETSIKKVLGGEVIKI